MNKIKVKGQSNIRFQIAKPFQDNQNERCAKSFSFESSHSRGRKAWCCQNATEKDLCVEALQWSQYWGPTLLRAPKSKSYKLCKTYSSCWLGISDLRREIKCPWNVFRYFNQIYCYRAALLCRIWIYSSFWTSACRRRSRASGRPFLLLILPTEDDLRVPGTECPLHPAIHRNTQNQDMPM